MYDAFSEGTVQKWHSGRDPAAEFSVWGPGQGKAGRARASFVTRQGRLGWETGLNYALLQVFIDNIFHEYLVIEYARKDAEGDRTDCELKENNNCSCQSSLFVER